MSVLPSTSVVPSPAEILAGRITPLLQRIQRRAFKVSVAEFALRLLLVFPLFWLCEALADQLFDLPWTARLLLLLVQIGLLIRITWNSLILPWKRRLDLTGTALLVETRMQEFRSGLISAVQLASEQPASPLVQYLVERVASQLQRNAPLQKVIPTEHLRPALGRVFGVLLLFLLASTLNNSTGLLARRILLSTERFPTATQIQMLTGHLQVNSGADAELSALATGTVPQRGYLVITPQNGRNEKIDVGRASGGSQFYYKVKNVTIPFTYRFELNDAVSPEFTVTPRILPALTKINFVQEYPAYTGLAPAQLNGNVLQLLSGGTLKINAVSNQPIQGVSVQLEGLSSTVPMQMNSSANNEAGGSIPIPDEGLTGLRFELITLNGEHSQHQTGYRVELKSDKSPLVVLKRPAAAKTTVLWNSPIPIEFTARDDFGISQVRLVYQVFRPNADGVPGSAETGKIPLALESSGSGSFNWQLSQLLPPLTEGSSMNWWLEVSDNRPGQQPGTGKSRTRTIAVISEEEKKLELLEAVGKRAAEVERLYHLQHDLNEKTDSIIRSEQP